MAFAFAILQTQSGSDIRDPVTLSFDASLERHWIPAFAGMTVNQAFLPGRSTQTRVIGA